MCLVFLVANQHRIRQVQRGVKAVSNITRGMLLGSSFHRLFWSGHTTERAVDLIYRAYEANLSATKIIKEMIADKKLEDILH
jgi:hypothetical protein